MKCSLLIWLCVATAVAATLPPTLDPGWVRTQPVREYTPKRLHQYNNGAAGTYLAYGFVRLRHAQYAKPGAAMVVDVFDMGEARNGFGIYSIMRSPDDTFVEVGHQGVVLEGQLDFWQGRYFVHVAPAQAEPVRDALALELGRAVATRLDGGGATVPELAQFPAEGLVANSTAFHRRGVLGCAGLSNGFVATYEVSGARVRALFADRAEPSQAAAALEAAREFVAKKGSAEPVRERGPRQTFAGRHSYYGRVVFAVEGTRLAGVTNVIDERACGKLIDALLAAKR